MNARLSALLIVMAGGLASALAAQTVASGDALRAALAGNTVQGSMAASGGFTEFYAEDGTIRGAGYTGRWSVEGNQMCFAYDGNPPGCWGAQIDGSQVIWLGGSGEEGTGTILPGNPNGF